MVIRKRYLLSVHPNKGSSLSMKMSIATHNQVLPTASMRWATYWASLVQRAHGSCIVMEYSYTPWFRNCFSSSCFLVSVIWWLLYKLCGLAGKCDEQKLTLRVSIKLRQKTGSHQAPSHMLREALWGKVPCHEGLSNRKLTAWSQCQQQRESDWQRP